MAVMVEEVRRLDGGSHPATNDVTAQLVAKAAAAFGLPNLVLQPSAEHQRRRSSVDQQDSIWETESRCSCTPLACTSAATGSRQAERKVRKAPSSPAVLAGNGEPSAAREGEHQVEICRSLSTDHSLSCTEITFEGVSIIDTKTANDGNLAERVEDASHGVPVVCAESGEERLAKEPDTEKQPLKETSDSELGAVEIEEKSERNDTLEQPLVSVNHRRRRTIAEFEKEWTFRPQLNLTSLRLASRGGRCSVPVSHRLYQRKAHSVPRLQDGFTFAPKLNTASLRLAQGRADRLPEVKERVSQLAAQRMAEACVHCTFHPNLSQRSLRMARRLETGFEARQQQLLLKRQKMMEEVPHLQQQQHSNYCKKSRAITLPTTSPPPSPRRHSVTPSPHSHPHTSPKTLPTPSDRQDQLKGRLLNKRTNHSSSSSSGRRRRRSSSNKIMTSPETSSETKRPTSTPLRRASSSTSSSTTPHSSPNRRSLVGGSDSRTSSTTPITPDGAWSRLSDTDRLKRVKILAEKAIKRKKVFVCRGGYSTIRRCLRERGWVEKDHKEIEEVEREKCAVGVDGANDEMGKQEYHTLCRAVRSADPNFVWTLRRDDSLYRNLLPSAFANHFAKASSFTTKVGLCANLRNLVWCGETHSHLFFPRCFLLSSPEEKHSFIDDYRFTTALNVLKLVTDQQWGRFKSPNNTFSPPTPPTTTTSDTPQNTTTGRGSSTVKIGPPSPPSTADPPEPPVVPEEAVCLALRACSAFVSSKVHEDIEEENKVRGKESVFQESLELNGAEWQTLINYYYKIVLEGGRVACSTQTVRKAGDMLDELEKYVPQLYMDGVRNIWIVKPGAMSRGRGIVCLERLEPILDLVSSPFHQEGKWVVQKYIERPLLIYGTKFDIRQWFLITDWAPLTMWMYKDCYLRFATQRFTLDNMNESVHLCNNSIQKNYTNSGSRSDLLPHENMWNSSTFKDYLMSLGHDNVWEEVIYPGMKHALTCAMMVSQDIVEGRKNSFELYGADFMLTDDFKPWLIEINCSPTMEASTSVTSQLCAQVMEDTIRVVVDRREDREASTGRFELAYKQPKFDTPSYVGIQLCVEGVAIHRNHTHHRSAPSLPIASLPIASLPIASLSYKKT